MRLALGILLALALALTAAWSGASLSLDNTPPTAELTAQGFLRRWQGLNTALALNPTNASYWNQGANLALFAGSAFNTERREAVVDQYLYRAGLLAPSWEMPLLHLANLQATRPKTALPEQASQCRALYLAALKRNPTYGYAHYRYADFLYDQALAAPRIPRDQVGVMCRHYGQALRLMLPTLHYYNPWYRTAETRAYANCLKLADNYTQARLLEPTTQKQWEDLGLFLAQNQGEMGWLSARSLLMRDLKNSGLGLPAYRSLAGGLRRGGLPRAGFEVLQEYTAQRPSDPAGWRELVRTMLRQRSIFTSADVIKAIVQAQKNASFSPELLSLLALAARQAGEVELALAILHQAVAAEPNNPKSLASLGDSLLAANRPKEAIQAYQRAVRLAPDLGEYRIALGLAYAQNKQFDAALREIQMVLDLNPQDKRARAALRKMGVY